jgi:hypothetical protein
VKLLDELVGTSAGPLRTPALRAYAASLLTTVSAGQRWGVTAGVPKSWKVAVKNGWYATQPGDYGPVWRWRINSVGTVWDSAGAPRWTIAVLGNTWRSFGSGVNAIQTISSRVAAVLTPPPPAP